MKEKIIEIFICILLIFAAIIPAAGILNQDIINDNQFKNEKEYYQNEFDEDWWRMFRHDSANTGCSTCVAPDNNSLYWQSSTNDSFSGVPIIVKNKLYITSWGYYDIDPPEPLDLPITLFHKKTNALCDIFGSYGILYDEYNNGSLYCLDAADGTQLWDFSVGVSSNPAVVYDKVYVTSSDWYSYESKIYCLDAETGETLIWQKSISGLVTSSVIVDNNKVYVGTIDYYSYSGKLYCLNAQNGTIIWTYEMQPFEYMYFSSTAVADDLVYFMSSSPYNYDGGSLYCLDAETGEHQWDQLTGYSESCSPVVVDGKVYAFVFDFYSYNGILYCFNAYTGSLVWTFDCGFIPLTLTNPVVYSDSLYIALVDYPFDNGEIYCVNKDTGSLIWDSQISGVSYLSSPSIADDKFYISVIDSTGYSGKIICLYDYGRCRSWEYLLDCYSFSSPAIASGLVFIPDVCGEIYAIGFSNDPPTSPNIGGTLSGKVSKSYDYTFVSTDPDDDSVMYFIDWGDNNTEWTEYSDSGEEIMLKHTWEEKGDYTIKAKAKDIHGAESEWGTLEITMPKNKAFIFNFPLLNWLFERFPNKLPILKYIMGLS